MPIYRNQASQRVLTVLAAFAGADPIHGVSELARTLNMSKNMVHRALATLDREGYLARADIAGRYRLGPRALTLGAQEEDELDIVALCRPYLEALAMLSGESVYLAIIIGMSRVIVDAIEGRGPRVIRHLGGRPVALHCTKISRVLLAHLEDGEIDAYLGAMAPLGRWAPFPDPASESAEAVWADIRQIRPERAVLWRNPPQHSATYAIVPLLDAAGRPHAAITVGGPQERLDMARAEALLARMEAILAPLAAQARLFPAPPFLAPAR